jgi:hypothetical protein
VRRRFNFIGAVSHREVFQVFVEAHKPIKAMFAHEKALEWQELFDLALRNNVSKVDVTSMGHRVAGMPCLKPRSTSNK